MVKAGGKRMNISELKRGQIIQDNTSEEKFLVISISKEKGSIKCMNQKFNEVSLGFAWINEYSIYDEIDMDSFISFIAENKTTNYDKIIEEINSELLSEIKKLKQNVNSYDRPWSEFFSANIKDLSETLKNIIIVKKLTKEE